MSEPRHMPPAPEPPDENEGLPAEIANAVRQQIGLSSIAIAQAVADMASAIVHREVSKLRLENIRCLEAANLRIDQLQGLLQGFRVVAPGDLAARIAKGRDGGNS